MPSLLAKDVAAVLITRGGTDIEEITAGWPAFGQVIIHTGAPNVFARWENLFRAGKQIVFVQDDDCIVPVKQLLKHWSEDDKILLNVPPGESLMVGWGALIRRGYAHRSFQRYLERYGMDALTRTFADFVVTSITPCRTVDLGHEDLPWATGADRLYNQPGHYDGQDEIRARCKELKVR